MEIVRRPPSSSLASLAASLRQLPSFSDLLLTLTEHRIRVRYKQSLLGLAWAVLQPLTLMLIFVAVFSVIARVPTGNTPYALFAYAGLLPWTAFASALSSGSASLVSHASLVTRVAFPREILPFTYVAAALFDLAVGSLVLLLLLAYYGIALTGAVFWLAPILFILTGLATTVALVLSAVNVRFRDVSVATPLLLQLWMFASPVIYPLDAVPQAWRTLYLLNPMAGIVDGFRRAVVDCLPPDPVALGWSAVITSLSLPLA